MQIKGLEKGDGVWGRGKEPFLKKVFPSSPKTSRHQPYSIQLDSWVGGCVEQIGCEDAQQGQHAGEGEESHLQWVIAAGEGEKRQGSHAGDVENVFNDDASGNQ